MTRRIDNDPRLLLITLWVQPIRILQVVVSTVILILPRLLFFPAQPLPYYLPFNPGCALIPVSGVLFGPSGAWGALLASLLADWMLNMDPALGAFRATGSFLFAFSAHLMWSRLAPRRDNTISWFSAAVRFCLASLPGALLSAAWTGFGSEALRLYPFPYMATMLLLQVLLFVPLIGAPLFAYLFTHPQTAQWLRLPAIEYPAWRFSGAALLGLTVSAGCAVASGTLIARTVYGIGPFSAFVIGVTNCPWVTAVVAPFVLLQLIMTFWGKSYLFENTIRH